MTSIDSLTLEVSDHAGAERFYAAAFGLGSQVQLHESAVEASGFRGFTLSLIVAQPSTATSLFDSAVAAGATVLKPIAKSLWGFGGVVQAPDGSIWKVATSAKKEIESANRRIDQIVLLLGATDVGASKKFYVDRGLTVGRSFGGYVEFTGSATAVKLALYKRKALAKDAGVPEEGSGSHRIIVGGNTVLDSDPDGFAWGVAA
jgi:uncharacterized glyoxalase superfamily protein PhnB